MRLRTGAGRGTTFGGFAFAALFVAALSGVALALPFDAHKPYDSVALLLLTNPGARFYRNIHYLAAQAFLLLTLLHVIDHLRRQTERRLTGAMWTRVTLSLPVSVFLMLSGFILKGDAEGAQAFRIIATTIGQIPLAGSALRVALFGPTPDAYQTLYMHHAATATILVWLTIAEHARRVWPRAVPVLSSVIVIGGAALLVTPTLHDGLDPLVRGPWYFLGVQELLHWMAQPGWVTALGVALVAAFLWLPRLPADRSRRLKVALGAALVAYLGVTVFALFFRGEDWSLAFPPRLRGAGIAFEWAPTIPALATVKSREIPVVLGRREGCLVCHANTRGLSSSHRPDAVGCAACHGGNPFTLDKSAAHRGIRLVPGNLADAARSCGAAECHASVVNRVQRSVMTTMSGVVAVDRMVIGQAGRESPGRQRPDTSARTTAADDVRNLQQSRADTHLRQLCASCHLGNEKRDLGAPGESSRGGGCNACHLNYNGETRQALVRYERDKRIGTARADGLLHPDISIDIGDDHCFGCHSRSGRISTSYEGWMELAPDSTEPSAARQPDAGHPSSTAKMRSFDDGRVFARVTADVHFDKGMTCVDCHTAREVMGDGVTHGRKSGQVRVRCEDCHVPRRPTVVPRGSLDAEARTLLALRDARTAGTEPGASARPLASPSGAMPSAGPFLALSDGAEALLHTQPMPDGSFRLAAKRSGELLELKRPAHECAQERGHRRLACISCHSAWAPRCTGCHTRFDERAGGYDHRADRDVTGAWIEEARDFRAAPPTLGVRVNPARDGRVSETIDTFVPGMVLTVASPGDAGRRMATFQRLYARLFPHTVTRASRSCESCHNDPVALGYGRGTLRFSPDRPGASAGAAAARQRHGRWTFTPDYPASPYDRLPADAWVGFLEQVTRSRSTRDDVRPFTVDEQKRILTAGACLTCHTGDSPVMRDAIIDFDAVCRRLTARCMRPQWD